MTTANLIRLAYLVFPTGRPNEPVSPTVFQTPISGGPSWIHSDRYRIEAKTEGRVNVEMMKGHMMRSLLEERFMLKLHRESKQIAVFALTVAKGGPNLQPAKAGGCIVYDRNSPPAPRPGEPIPVSCGVLRRNVNGGFDISGVTVPDLCRRLSAYVDREILDRTGIAGAFDVHLDLDVSDVDAVSDTSSSFTPGYGPAIASAAKKLGLEMRAAKGTSQFLVIDHVERPSEN